VLKNILIICGAIIFLTTLLSSYTAPAYNEINMTLCNGYTAPAYNEINFTLTVADTCGGGTNPCDCPGADTDWAVNMSKYCTLETACDLATGNLTFTDTGWFNISNTLDCYTIGGLATGQTVYINGTGVLNIEN